MSKTSYFSAELFRFLRDLKTHNEKAWFEANKERYLAEARDPLLRFIGDFSSRLRKISPQYVADPRPVGGSLMRPYRDTRFSADKSPYKTMTGALFRHQKGKSVPAPAFMIHLEPGNCFAGIGLHGPDSQTLSTIRKKIFKDPQGWKAAISANEFKAACSFMGESLKRPPKGYSEDHPCIEDLKRKDICTITPYSEREVCAPDFLERFAGTCAAASDFMKYLTTSLGLPW